MASKAWGCTGVVAAWSMYTLRFSIRFSFSVSSFAVRAKICQGGRIQYVGDALFDLLPDHAAGAATLFTATTRILLGGAGRQVHRPLQGPDHLPNRHLRGVMGQGVTPTRAPASCHQPRPAEPDHDLAH